MSKIPIFIILKADLLKQPYICMSLDYQLKARRLQFQLVAMFCLSQFINLIVNMCQLVKRTWNVPKPYVNLFFHLAERNRLSRRSF